MPGEITAVHPVLMARDVTASMAFYERLGFAPVFQDNPITPRYAVVRRGTVELHLRKDQPHNYAGLPTPEGRQAREIILRAVG